MLGSGHIDFNEFLVMMSQTKEKGQQAEMRQAFKLFDSDGDGFITFDDLKRVMRNCGENLSEVELKNMFTKADINRDNLVDMKGKQTQLKQELHSRDIRARNMSNKVTRARVSRAVASRLARQVEHGLCAIHPKHNEKGLGAIRAKTRLVGPGKLKMAA